MQPALGVDGLGRGGRVVPIALHDLGTTREDLAVLGHAQLGVGQRLADATGALASRSVDRQDRARFGEPVALAERHAGAHEEVAHLGRERGGARHGELDPAAEGRTQLAEDEPVGHRPPQGEPRTGPAAGGLRRRLLRAHRGGPEEDRSLEAARVQGLAHDAAVDLLE